MLKNSSMLAKIGWRLIKEPQSLLAQVLKGKYFRDQSFMESSIPASASHGWRSILAGREVLKKGLGWAVGDGDSIQVWNDPWLSFDFPRQPFGPPNAQDQTLTVKDLLCPLSNKWSLERVRRYLPQYEDIILSIKTSSVQSQDTLVWLYEKSGEYSTKTGYGLCMTINNSRCVADDPVQWLRDIWNVKTSPKLKDFLWRIAQRAIPVSSNLERRGVPRFNCKKCGAYEDELHVFLRCTTAEEVWNLIDPGPYVMGPPAQTMILLLPPALLTTPPDISADGP